MAYQPIEKPIPKYYNGREVWGKRDCEDFKSYFWNRKYCKLSNKCKTKGYHSEYHECIEAGDKFYRINKTLCTGIDKDRWRKIIS